MSSNDDTFKAVAPTTVLGPHPNPAAWAIFTFLNVSAGKSELLVYQLCVGLEQNLCPSNTTFVRNQGEDTVTKWAQRECASYKTRRIIISDGPTKECGCYVADVSCSSE